MNIFYLSRNPLVAVQGLGDIHLLRQITDAAQALDTAHNVHLVPQPVTVFSHPCCEWTRRSREDYWYLFQYFEAALDEYAYRFGKTHAYERYVAHLRNIGGCTFKDTGWVDPPKMVPAPFTRLISTEHAYRAYYRHQLQSKLTWTKRGQPAWLTNIHER